MNLYKSLTLVLAIFMSLSTFAQNLPSTLTGKNINATFSILAYDSLAQEWGIAVATNNLYVGNSTIYIEPGLGAFSVIAETEPDYAHNGFEQLKAGKSIEEAILTTKNKDRSAFIRQVSGIDTHGNVYAFTGKSLKYWTGNADHLLGKGYVVMGNQLGDDVLKQMASTFEDTPGSLAERLLKSLIAGQLAGGQVSGKQSAALVVKGTNNEWYNQIDLRVDHSKQPFLDLQRLLNYHYGRIRLNQAQYSYEASYYDRAKEKLKAAEDLLDGWNGMYANIALMHSRLGQDDQAAEWVKKAILENVEWKVQLPLFYYLKDHPQLKGMIHADTFSIKDWENAYMILIRLGKPEALYLLDELNAKGIDSSYLQYLTGKLYEQTGVEQQKAILHLEKALLLDPDNIEAELLLKRLK